MKEIVLHLQTNPDHQYMFFFMFSFRLFQAAVIHIVVQTMLPMSQLLSDVVQHSAAAGIATHPEQRRALNDDLLVQKTHRDIIAVRSRFLSVSLRPPPGRFTAASAAPGQQRAASLCLHNRQEGRRKLNEVSTEHYVNEKVLLSVMTLKRTNTLEEGDSSSCCLMKNIDFFFNPLKKKVCLSYIHNANSK